MIQLNEQVFEKYEVIELDKAKLPEGVLARVVYPICNIGERNKNNRVYERAVWDKVLADKEIKEKLENRCLFGQAEHPKESQSNLEKTSHVINRMWIDESEGKVKQEIDILDTEPFGRIVDTLIRAGCGVGVSTRAEGDLEEANDDQGSYMRVLPGPYNYITTDFTADPSTIKPYPESVQVAVVSEIKAGLEHEKCDKEFATSILEHMKVKEAGQLLESLREEKKESKEEIREEVKFDKLSDEQLIEKYNETESAREVNEDILKQMEDEIMGRGYRREEVDESEDIKAMYKKAGIKAPDGKGIHTKKFHECVIGVLKGDKEGKLKYENAAAICMSRLGRDKAVRKSHWAKESKSEKEKEPIPPLYEISEADEKSGKVKVPVFECYDDMVEYFRKALAEAPEKHKEKIKGIILESRKEEVDTMIDEAISRAERDKVIAYCDTLYDRIDNKDMEIKLMVKKMKEAAAKSDQPREILERKLAAVNLALEKRYKEVKALESKVDSIRQKHASEIKMAAARLKKVKEDFKNQIDSINKKYEEKLVESKQACNRAFIKEYVNMKLESSGLKVPENVRALLEKASSTEEAEKILKEVKDAICEGALHLNKPLTEITVPAEVDEEVLKVHNAIGRVMSGM